jgi:hypothetical protein
MNAAGPAPSRTPGGDLPQNEQVGWPEDGGATRAQIRESNWRQLLPENQNRRYHDSSRPKAVAPTARRRSRAAKPAARLASASAR